MKEYSTIKQINELPNIPLEGSIDLTYRCNNNCRHCWLRIPKTAKEIDDELTFDNIKQIASEAREMGCRHWNISGGEPMLREDFEDILEFLIHNAASYSLNTNGTLITPKIAKLMKAKGNKLVALYGADSRIHDHITRNPGSFDATVKGMKHLKEAGAGFIIQIVPMKDNYQQMDGMIKFAESMCKHWRIGANWLYLTGCNDEERNLEILHQRLEPKDVLIINRPEKPDKEAEEKDECRFCHGHDNENLFAQCIKTRRDFHLDPYGELSFCCFIKDPKLRYNVKDGSFKEFWNEFMPSISDKIIGGKEYKENCGSCDLREDCLWCPVYGFLEYQNYSAKVEYLCHIAKETKKYKKKWIKHHRAFYKISGITIQVDSDIPISDTTFQSKFKLFETDGPGDDTIYIRHYFTLPDLNGLNMGKQVFRQLPWAIYQKNDSWIYVGISEMSRNNNIHRVAVVNAGHTNITIYNNGDQVFRKGGLHSLTMFPSDQLLIARALADRQACYLHSSGIILGGQGLLFAGHSEAGKSTIAALLKDKAEILCDDRIILRKWPEGYRIHGTWSHGDIPVVSPNSAPLKAIMFLEQAKENRIVALHNKKEIISRVLAYLIKPFETRDWWEKMLSLIQDLVQEVPCYLMYFDKSREIINLIEEFVASEKNGDLYT